MAFDTTERNRMSRLDIGWTSFWAGFAISPITFYWVLSYAGKLHVFGDLACVYLK